MNDKEKVKCECFQNDGIQENLRIKSLYSVVKIEHLLQGTDEKIFIKDHLKTQKKRRKSDEVTEHGCSILGILMFYGKTENQNGVWGTVT